MPSTETVMVLPVRATPAMVSLAVTLMVSPTTAVDGGDEADARRGRRRRLWRIVRAAVVVQRNEADAVHGLHHVLELLRRTGQAPLPEARVFACACCRKRSHALCKGRVEQRPCSRAIA